MADIGTWKKGWSLLSNCERRAALFVLGIVIFAGIAAAGMIGSIMPFLSVLSDQAQIRNNPYLAFLYTFLGLESDYMFLVILGVASLFVILFSSAVQIIRSYAVARFSMMRMHSISHRLLASYLKQPYEFFLNQHTGEIGTQILSESENVVNYFFRPAAGVIASLVSILFIAGLLLWIDPIVTLASTTTLGLIYGSVFYYTRFKLGKLGELRLLNNRARYRITYEALGGVKDIKLLGREASYVDRFEVPSITMARCHVAAVVLGEVPSYVLQCVAFAGMIVLCLVLLDPTGFGEGAGLNDIIPLIGVFAFAGQRLMPELQRVHMGLTQLQYGRSAVNAVFEDTRASASSRPFPEPHLQPLTPSEQIELVGVTYRYPNSPQSGLTELSFRIHTGEKVGVVGTTGSGKTTLADLILGLIEPSEGAVYVDGVVLNSSNTRNWQRSVGYVPQDIFLIDASILENIGLGIDLDKIDRERVIDACRIAQLDAFIESDLVEGYDTVVGERGIRLSGGQRQRIGIARAIYNDAQFLLFDEATSALDNLTERELMSSINALPGDKTIVIIAHRLSTLKICDRILVLDEGRLVANGNWHDLMSGSETFRRFALVEEAA